MYLVQVGIPAVLGGSFLGNVACSPPDVFSMLRSLETDSMNMS